MRRLGPKATLARACPAVVCAALALGLAAPVAQGAATDPLYVFTPVPPESGAVQPPPIGYLYGPCGLTVDSAGDFYVSDYYHHTVDLYNGAANYASANVTGATGYLTQLANEDPLDGPCGLAVDSTGRLYVNNFHRNVAGETLSPFPYRSFPLPASSFSAGTILAGAGGLNDASAHPTGVAVDSADNVYVDERTYVEEYDSSGSPVKQIGLDPNADYYGVAVSGFAGAVGSSSTQGFLYVPDASTNTVKVFDPATSLTTPVAQLKRPPSQLFSSLKDAAVAVDNATGDVYIADNTQPLYTERPQATIYVFRPATAPLYTYQGHLKYNVTDALPPGLTVDNSAQSTQGRVYVTSGNTEPASIYAYAPGSATTAATLPPLGNATGGSASASAGSGQSAPASPEPAPSSASSAPAPASSPAAISPPRRAKRHRPKRRHRHHRRHHRTRKHPRHRGHTR